MNIARYFAESTRWHVTIHSTRAPERRREFSHSLVKFFRSPFPTSNQIWQQIVAYLRFHLGTALRLLFTRPDAILYIEPQSSFPVLISSCIMRPSALLIHHHEYHAPAEFHAKGMRLARIFHLLEQKRLFPMAAWISHTNQRRLELFLEDNPTVPPNIANVLPNFPPQSWFGQENHAWTRNCPPPVRFVYVGSLSKRDTYIEEFLDWIEKQESGSVKFDILAYNVDPGTREMLLSIRNPSIRFFSEGVEYDELPRVLREYHVGVILYKASTPNYRYNASNKLFEYLACGLDVLYPSRMLGVKPYARTNTAPRVIEFDFESNCDPDLKHLFERSPAASEAPFHSAEEVAGHLEHAILARLNRK